MPKNISIKYLHLFLDNPRLPSSANEIEALLAIVDDQKSKLIQLATDIAQNGLSSIESIAVFPATEFGRGHYYVAEGNRRISALKLLKNPALIEDRYPSIAKSFKKIRINPEVDLTHISAEIFPAEDDPELIRLLRLRHLGEQEGRGVVRWNATQKARFDEKYRGSDATVHLLDELENRHILTKEQRDSVTKTNWDRVLRPIGLDFLGLTKDQNNGLLIIPEDRLEEFVKKIRLIAQDLNGKKVGYVYNQEQVLAFYEKMAKQYREIEHSPIEDLSPHAQNNPTEAQPINPDPKPSCPEDSNSSLTTNPGKNDTNATPSNDSRKPKATSPIDLFANCKTVIPLKFELRSRNVRIAKIIDELKHLDVEKYPNACGTLLRTLIELSAKEYLEHTKSLDDATKLEFQPSISQACRQLYDLKKIDGSYSSAISKEKELVRELFNGYMHNTDSYPSSTVIRDTFKTFLKFIEYCLE